MGPGAHLLTHDSIASKQQQATRKKELSAVRNNYKNYVFDVYTEEPKPYASRPADESDHKSTEKEHVQSKSNPAFLSTQEENFIKSRLVSFGALYDKIKLRESLQRGKLSKHGEFREAAQPAPEALR